MIDLTLLDSYQNYVYFNYFKNMTTLYPAMWAFSHIENIKALQYTVNFWHKGMPQIYQTPASPPIAVLYIIHAELALTRPRKICRHSPSISFFWSSFLLVFPQLRPLREASLYHVSESCQENFFWKTCQKPNPASQDHRLCPTPLYFHASIKYLLASRKLYSVHPVRIMWRFEHYNL